MTEDALDELAHAGITLVSHQARPLGDGTDLHAMVWLRAADEAEAISLVKNALDLYGSFSDFKAKPVNYSMYLGFLEAEAPEMEAEARNVAAQDPRISSVLASDPSKGAAELLLDIPADDADDAVEQAKAIYADLRARAGLPHAEPLYGFLGPTGYFPTTPLPLRSPRHIELAQQARQLFDAGSYDYAVVAAQTACEVMAFDAINELLTAGSGAVTLLFASRWFAKNNKTPSLNEDRLRDLWNALAEDEIQSTEWWASYKDHLGRRHGIVHRGAVPTEGEAEQSLKATDAFRTHVSLKIQEALQQNGST